MMKLRRAAGDLSKAARTDTPGVYSQYWYQFPNRRVKPRYTNRQA